MLRVCLDLNVWCASFLAAGLGRKDMAAGFLAGTVRSGSSNHGPVGSVISLGMLERLRTVIVRDLGFARLSADRGGETWLMYYASPGAWPRHVSMGPRGPQARGIPVSSLSRPRS
jgi:hypothetical protein